MRLRFYVLLGGSILLTGCPMGGASSSFNASKTQTATSSSTAVEELAMSPEKDEPAARERPIIVRRERGSPLEVHADKLKTSDDGGALAATIVSKGETIAQDVPLGEISGIALEPNTTYVVEVEDVRDPAQPEPVEQITVVTPARPPEVVSVEPLGGDRILVEIDLRDNPPGTPVALGAAAAGASEPDLLLDPRTGAPLPAGAEPFVDPSATIETPVEEQAAEAATVGVELGATVGVSGSSDSNTGDGDTTADVESSGSGEAGGAGPVGGSGDASGSGSTLLVVVSLPSAGGDVGMVVQAQNDQGVTTGWSEPVSPASAQVEPEIVEEHAEDTQDDAAASTALEESADVEEPTVAPTAVPASDASPAAMIAWLRVRIASVRQELREARNALAASRRDLRAARAELRAAKQELARLQKASRKQKKSVKSPDVDPASLSAARVAVDTAQGAVDEAERGIAEPRRRRKELRTSLEELIDELRTRRAAGP
jgi:hypothetical protein